MKITKIESVTKTRYKVFIDEEFAFILYKGELSKFNIKEDGTLDSQELEQIYETLLKRAKLRAMHLLETMARTESQLRQKLTQTGYPDKIVEEAIRYVKSFGYINDEMYIRNFIDTRREKKSKREIIALLYGKGLDSEMIDKIVSEAYEEHSDREAILSIIQKKGWHDMPEDEKERNKRYGYLVRKGFRYEDIKKAFSSESDL